MECGILVMAALKLGYPAVPLLIAMLIHIATRVISADGVVSIDVMLSDISIIAGCSHSVSWTRCFLYDLLETLHRAYMPYTKLNSWVDDLSWRTRGTARMVAEKIFQCAQDLALRICAFAYRPRRLFSPLRLSF